MLRTSIIASSLLVLAAVTACSASSSDMPAERGGSGNGTTGGTNSGAAGKTGSGGTSGNAGSNNNAGAGGTFGNAGSTGIAGASGAATGGSAGTSTGSAGSGSGLPPLFSDDFEGASIATKWTKRINSNGTFTLDTSQKHGGNQSLHVTQNGFSTMLAAEGAPIFPAPNNEYYARVWIRVGTVTGGNAAGLPTGHVIWIETGDVTNDTHEVRVGANLGYFQSNLVPSDTDIRDPMAKMTADAWHCIQLHYGNDLLDVSLDGVHSSISTTNWAATDSANGNTTPRTGWSPTYAAFRIGYELGGPADVWYDDVAIDHAPIACN